MIAASQPAARAERTQQKTKPIITGSIRALFRAAAKAVADRVTETLRPKTRRRKSGDDTRELFPRARHLARRTTPRAAATAYLAETLDWLHLWDNNADIGSHAASSYNAEQSHSRPQL